MTTAKPTAKSTTATTTTTAPTVFFVRHGESEANARNVFAGIRDNSRLTVLGKQQAQDAANAITARHLHIDHIMASPLDRTRQTAEIIAHAIGFDPAAIIWEKRLAEYDMGLLTGTPIHPITSAEIVQHPEAEDPEMFKRRLLAVVAEAKALGGVTLLVSHAGTGRMFEAIHKHTNPMDFYDLQGFINGELVELKL